MFVLHLLSQDFAGELKCIFNNDNSAQLVLQIRIAGDEPSPDKEEGADEVSPQYLSQLWPTCVLSLNCRGTSCFAVLML
jgi:hypothetical protein